MIGSSKSLLRALFVLYVTAGLAACDDGANNPAVTVDAPDMLGSFAVGHSTFSAIDVVRDNRMLAVEVWYPVDAADQQATPRTTYALGSGIDLDSAVAVEGLPVSARENQNLLVFSHGYGGINTASVVLMETLASHGFIVVAPEHTGNSQSSSDDSFDEAAGNRVPDVSFLIDSMLARSREPGDVFYNRIDAGSVGVLGHSFGGMTAVGMAAGWAGADPDPRVTAIVPISAVIDGDLQSDERTGPNAGFTAEQLARITVPVMLMGGTEDINVFIENNSIALQQLVNAPAVYQVDIIGANHTHFANVCDIGNLLIELGLLQDSWPAIGAEGLLQPYALTCGPDVFPIEEAVRLQNLYIVSFFKRHLLDDSGYDYYLSSEVAQGEPAVVLTVK